MKIFNDKYVMTSIAIILVIASLCVLSSATEASDDDITGVITDVHKSSNGNVFYVMDSEGTTTKCFISSGVSVGSVCTVNGSFSEDGEIFFVTKLILR